MVVGVFFIGSTACVLLIRNVMVAFDNHSGGIQEEIMPPGSPSGPGLMLHQPSCSGISSRVGSTASDHGRVSGQM